MKIIITLVKTITREAHIDIPDGQSTQAIRQEIVDRYNNGQMTSDFNIIHVDFHSLSAQVVTPNQNAELVSNL